MKIEWIEVENFKGFDKRRFEFDDHFTLIVGENGSGKSTALTAAAVMIGAWVNIVTGNDTSQHLNSSIRWRGRIESSGIVYSPVLPLTYRGRFAYPTIGDPRIHVPLLTVVETSEKSDEPCRKLRNQMNAARAEAGQVLEGQLPVCVYYGSGRSFQHSDDTDWNKIMAAKTRRYDGYANWDLPDIVAKQLDEWLGSQEAIHFQEGIEPPAAIAVKNAIVRCLPGAAGMRFSAKYGEPVIEWEGRTATGYSRLSDGQRLILALVGDIARRCAILNPHLEGRAVEETPGIVLIDEIDLHLHPRWQLRIMEDLQRVFPKVQFIVTTHSPVIISAAKGAKVIQLDAEGSHEVAQAYGMDVNWVVDVVQGADSQAPEVAALVRKAHDLIEDARLEEARQVAAELERIQNGPSPDSVGITAHIENLLALAHAED